MVSLPAPPKIEKPSVAVVWLVSVMVTFAIIKEASITSTCEICASFALFRLVDVADRTIVSEVPLPPVTVSAPANPMNVSLPEPPVRESAPLPPRIVKPSLVVVWFVRVMITPPEVAEASIASRFVNCPSVALLKSVDVAESVRMS